MDYDVFNGDADGICALHQLRLATPRKAKLVTGVKRDIKLLDRLGEAEGARVTVLDISLDRNREELLGLLLRRCSVLYIDHHYSGDLPSSGNLTAHIDPDPEVCTSVIVDRLLGGRYRAWAVAAAFGDNLAATARKLAGTLGLSSERIEMLRELGELMNYNGYGADLSDLHFPPADLYRAVKPYEDPFFFYERSEIMRHLRKGFADDMGKAATHFPETRTKAGEIYRFPAEPWAKRVAGVFMNLRARENENAAHALLVDNGDKTMLVSVRAPLANRTGADTLCRAFPTGGGRAAAAGINRLPETELSAFRVAFEEVFRG